MGSSVPIVSAIQWRLRSETDGDRSTGAREGSGQPARGAARRARRAGASEAIFDGDRRRNANGGGSESVMYIVVFKEVMQYETE